MTFRLYDSATREVRDLDTVVPGQVSIYHCGLTVQSSPHLGHIRKEVVFDVLRRWLTAKGLGVTVVANVTDIDDKILAKSAEAGVPWFAHAYTFERELHRAYAALGCEQPTYEPRATGHIPEMVTMVSELIDRGHAYVAADGSGDVYFDVKSWPSYGELSHQRVDDMVPAEDSDPRGKRDPRDFALWKGYKPTEPLTASWPAPWGRGRPGWHLECSAMAIKYLGDEFDIHGGGIDLRFPHHENELAQARASGHPFARYWMHNAWVTAAGEKMSKSLLNGALVSEVTAQYPPRAVRFYLAVPHYRSSIEYSSESLTEASASLARIDGFVDRAVELVGQVETSNEQLPASFVAALDDDLGTSSAMADVYELVRVGNQALTAGDRDGVRGALVGVQSMLDVFGLRADDKAWQAGGDARLRPILDGVVTELLDQRQAARARKDFAAADSIRNRLTSLGVVVEDTPNGPRWSL
ncbi:MAG: cysteine--tRNA ligase [Actinobacteria bacterium]|nr:cysteine--tRNA ligase [Actinomycetota bacterium]